MDNSTDTTEKQQVFEEILSLERAQEIENQFEKLDLPPGFFFSEGNLFYQPEQIEGKDPILPIYICSELRILACTRDDHNENHGRLLEFHDVDGVKHEWAMPMELLAGDGTRYREELLGMGLRISPGAKARQLLTQYIQLSVPRKRARCVGRTGWHNLCFLLPEQIIGHCGQEKVILQTGSSNFPLYNIAGTVEEWRKEVALLCKDNPLLIFSVSAAFAPPLLHPLNLENGGFHFRGDSSIGKTTLLYAAASVWGFREIPRWRATTNGIEALAAAHNDCLLCLDELSEVDPLAAGEIAYLLSNGTGKQRADRHGHSRKRASWRILFLSNGEISLSDHMLQAGRKSRAGQEVRLLDISCDTEKYRVFHELHGHADGSEFSTAVKRASQNYYGSPSREFLKNIIQKNEIIIPVVQQFMDQFLGENVPADADGQVHRAARRFAIVAAAGELATSFGITGWNEEDVLWAAKSCFLSWLKNRGGTGPQEEQLILSQVRRFFELHGEGRFTLWDSSPEFKTINRAGYRKRGEDGEVEFFVLPETFKVEIAAGFGDVRVAKVCLKHRLLKGGSNGEFTRSERLPGMNRNVRCYRFNSKVLGSDESEKS